MFQTKDIRLNQLDTAVFSKIMKIKIFFMFLSKCNSFYTYIFNYLNNKYISPENLQLYNKYYPHTQNYKLKYIKEHLRDSIDSNNLHKLYCDYLHHCSYKLLPNFDSKFFINKWYKHKLKYIKLKVTKSKWIASGVFNYLRKKKKLGKMSGQIRIIRTKFFKNQWVYFKKKIHNLDYKITLKSKQYQGYMHLATKQLSPISRFTAKPYKNKKIFKNKLKKIKKKKKIKNKLKKKINKKKYYLKKKNYLRNYKRFKNNWLKIKKLTPVVSKKYKTPIKSIFNRKIERKSISGLKHVMTVKHLLKMRKISIKTNNYSLYKLTKLYKLPLKNLTSSTLLCPKRKKKVKFKFRKNLNSLFNNNSNKRIRWNLNIYLFNTFFKNNIDVKKNDFFTKILFIHLFLKFKLKKFQFNLKNFKKFLISKRIFLTKHKLKKKNLKKKKFLLNKTKRLLYTFYKQLKKKQYLSNNKINKYKIYNKNFTFFTFYNTYNKLLHETSLYKLTNSYTNRNLTVDYSLKNKIIFSFFKKNVDFINMKNLNALSMKKVLNYDTIKKNNFLKYHSIINKLKSLVIFFKKNCNKQSNINILQNYNMFQELIFNLYKHPEQFKFCLNIFFSYLLKIKKKQNTQQQHQNQVLNLKLCSKKIKLQKINTYDKKSLTLLKFLRTKLLKLNISYWVPEKLQKSFKKSALIILYSNIFKKLHNLNNSVVLNWDLANITKYIEKKFNETIENLIKLKFIKHSRLLSAKKTLLIKYPTQPKIKKIISLKRKNYKKNMYKNSNYINLLKIYEKISKKNQMKGIFKRKESKKILKHVKLSKINNNFFYNFKNSTSHLKKKYASAIKFNKREMKQIMKLGIQYKKIIRANLLKSSLKNSRQFTLRQNIFLKKQFNRQPNHTRWEANYIYRRLKKLTKSVQKEQFKNPKHEFTKTDRSKHWENRLYNKWLSIKYKNTIIRNSLLLYKQKKAYLGDWLINSKKLNKYFLPPFGKASSINFKKKKKLKKFKLPLMYLFRVIQSIKKKTYKNKKKNKLFLLQKFKLLSCYKKYYLKNQSIFFFKKKQLKKQITEYKKYPYSTVRYRSLRSSLIRRKFFKKIFKLKKWIKNEKLKNALRINKKIKKLLVRNNIRNVLKFQYKARLAEAANDFNKKKIRKTLNINSQAKLNRVLFFSKKKNKAYLLQQNNLYIKNLLYKKVNKIFVAKNKLFLLKKSIKKLKQKINNLRNKPTILHSLKKISHKKTQNTRLNKLKLNLILIVDNKNLESYQTNFKFQKKKIKKNIKKKNKKNIDKKSLLTKYKKNLNNLKQQYIIIKDNYAKLLKKKTDIKQKKLTIFKKLTRAWFMAIILRSKKPAIPNTIIDRFRFIKKSKKKQKFNALKAIIKPIIAPNNKFINIGKIQNLNTYNNIQNADIDLDHKNIAIRGIFYKYLQKKLIKNRIIIKKIKLFSNLLKLNVKKKLFNKKIKKLKLRKQYKWSSKWRKYIKNLYKRLQNTHFFNKVTKTEKNKLKLKKKFINFKSRLIKSLTVYSHIKKQNVKIKNKLNLKKKYKNVKKQKYFNKTIKKNKVSNHFFKKNQNNNTITQSKGENYVTILKKAFNKNNNSTNIVGKNQNTNLNQTSNTFQKNNIIPVFNKVQNNTLKKINNKLVTNTNNNPVFGKIQNKLPTNVNSNQVLSKIQNKLSINTTPNNNVNQSNTTKLNKKNKLNHKKSLIKITKQNHNLKLTNLNKDSKLITTSNQNTKNVNVKKLKSNTFKNLKKNKYNKRIPSTYKFLDVKEMFTKILNRRQTGTDSLLSQYINIRTARKQKPSDISNSLQKIHKKWKTTEQKLIKFAKLNNQIKINSTMNKIIEPKIKIKIKRHKLKNNLKFTNLYKKPNPTPNNIEHLVTLLSNYPTNTNNLSYVNTKGSRYNNNLRFFIQKKKIPNTKTPIIQKQPVKLKANWMRLKPKKVVDLKEIQENENFKRVWSVLRKKLRRKNKKIKKIHFSNKFKQIYNNILKFKLLFSRINNERFYQIINNKLIKLKNNDKYSQKLSVKNSIIPFAAINAEENLNYFITKLKSIVGIYKIIKLEKKKLKLKTSKNRKKKQSKFRNTSLYLLNKHPYSEPKHVTPEQYNFIKKKIYNIVVRIKKKNITTSSYVITKLKNVLSEKKKNNIKLIVYKYPYYKSYTKLFFKQILIREIRKNLTINTYKYKLQRLQQKAILKIKPFSLNYKQLLILNNLIKTSPTLKKQKNKKIIFKSLITNLNTKLGKAFKHNSVKTYYELHKLLNRQNSRKIFKKNIKAIYSKNNKLISNEVKAYHKLFYRNKLLLTLRLSKKIRTLNYLVKSLKKSKKIKKRKWKKIKRKWLLSKKLILKKKYILRKKIYLITKYNTMHNKQLTMIRFNIRNYLFLNKPAYESSILNFYFKTISTNWKFNKKSKKTLFFNFRNKKLTTYRNARKLHWSNCTHKRLNKRKYSSFIKKWVKNTNNYWNTFKTHCMFKFNFSHQFWENFILLYRFVYNKALEFKVISQLPIHTMFWWFLNLQKKLIQKVSLKINFWQEKKNKIKKTFWMEQKKNLPKFIKKKLFRLYRSLSALHYDYITNAFIMLKNLQQPIHNNLYFINNKLLKLHNFKYKS